MEASLWTRRQILKNAGAIAGLGAMSSLLTPGVVLADDERASERCDRRLQRFGPWLDPVPITELASNYDDFNPAISRNGLSLYFSTTRFTPVFSGAIVVVQRRHRHAPWDLSTLKPVNSLNARGSNALSPNLTPDGHVMYLQSGRLGYGGKLFVSHRPDADDDQAWEAPKLVPGSINTPPGAPLASEVTPTYFRDPATGVACLYYARFSGQVRFQDPTQDSDIFVSTRDDSGKFARGTRVDALEPDEPPEVTNGIAKWSRQTATAIRRDGLEMFITSNRQRGVSYSGEPIENLWVATRSDPSNEDWKLSDDPIPCLNSGFGDGGPALSWDATTLYFYSRRIQEPPGVQQSKPGHLQLWMSTRETLED